MAQGLRQVSLRNWMLVVAVICQVATVLITWNVWRVRDQPINLPLFPFTRSVGKLPVFNLTGPLLLLSLAVVLVRPRVGVVVHAAVYLLAVMFDQYRLQPQFFSLIVLMFACAYEKGLWFARWYLASLWLWTGIHKLLSAEWLGVESHSFLASCGINADGWNFQFAVLVGFSEVVLGLLAIFAPRKAIPLCLAIHLGILFLLSPLLANHNESVWPWNLATAVIGTWILSTVSRQGERRTEGDRHILLRRLRKMSQFPTPSRAWLQYAVVMTLFIVPAGFYLDWVNSRLCFVLYSGNLPRAMHCSSDQLKRLDGWTGLTVPFPNSPRLFVQVFEHEAEAGDKLYVSDPRRWVPDRYFLKTPNGTVVKISRERFYRDAPSTGEVSGIEFDSRNALWHLRRAGGQLVEDGNRMVSKAVVSGGRFGDREFELLRKLPNLRELKAEDTAVTDRGLQSLAGLRRLEILEIEGGHLTGECLSVVQQLPALNWLRLENVAVTSNGIRTLDGLGQIHTLHLSNTRVDDRALQHIGTLKNLRWLDLSNSKVTGATLDELESLEQLDWINLSGTAVDDDALPNLGRLKRIEILELARTKISDRGLTHLSKLPECRTLDLEHTNITDTGLMQLAAMRRLQLLKLQGTEVTEQGVRQLRQKLTGCRIEWENIDT